MSEQLHFLHLEDNQFSSKLVREQLDNQWPGCRLTRVETEAGFRDALAEGGFDLILADYSLPDFDGLSALMIAKQSAADIPFIFLSGTMGEVVAIEAIQNGATDYVLKSGLYRLIPAIQRALQERAERLERMSLRGIIAKLQIAIEQAPLSIIMTDADGVIEYVNPKLSEMTGYPPEALLGQTPRIFKSPATDPMTHREIWETIRGGGVWKGTLCNQKHNGDLYYESAIIAPVKNGDGTITNYIGIKEDVTERRILEAQLQHAQKMEIVGQLAGGIAHDFNNILTVIAGFGFVLQREVSASPRALELVDHILQAGTRASELTRSLLTFSRKGELKLAAVSLNEIVVSLEKSLLRLIKKNIEFDTALADYPLLLMADKGQLEQVIVNLVLNASDAMPDGGRLLMGTEVVVIAEKGAHCPVPLAPGTYALITVSDSGCGMDEKTMEHIFDPFFTTKEAGKGTGLGLSIVHGIVEKHGGRIAVESVVGSGTTFKVYLPLLEHALVSSEVPELTEVPGGNETILIADSDPAVRKVLSILLSLKGYHLLLVEDGEEGVRSFTANQEEIRLVMAETIMPKKNGREMYREICRIKSHVPVIFMNGNGDDVGSLEVLDHNHSYLSKPIKRPALLAQVREMLDRDRTART